MEEGFGFASGIEARGEVCWLLLLSSSLSLPLSSFLRFMVDWDGAFVSEVVSMS